MFPSTTKLESANTKTSVTPSSFGGIGKIAGHVLLILLSLLALFPVYWMIVTSLRPANDIFSSSLIPTSPSFENYRTVWNTIPIAKMLMNTLIMSVLLTVFQLLTAILSAYAFARWTFFADKFLLGLFALTWLVPFQVTMIPNYVLISSFGWLDTMTAIVVPQFASAFAVMLLFQSLKAFPQELIDAARIDGANDWLILWRVIVPNLRASLASLAILLFISAWNEYFWPLLVTRNLENAVVQIGLQMFLTQEGDLWGPLMAAATLASLPILLLYVVLQKQIIESFMKSGIR
jgi:sn-glycerol 3-phosphate transport system permease protein